MATRGLLRTFSTVRSTTQTQLKFTRTYISSAVRTPVPTNVQLLATTRARGVVIKAQQAAASTATTAGVAGTGNPDIIDSLPSTSQEVKGPPLANGNGNGNGRGHGSGLDIL